MSAARMLIIHSMQARYRKTTVDFVRAFERYLPDVAVEYHHWRQPLTAALRAQRFDAVLLSYDFLSYRQSAHWPAIVERYRALRDMTVRLIALPQDDYTYSAVLDDTMVRLGVDTIYSPLESGLDLVYEKSAGSIPIRFALTGYVDPISVDELEHLALPFGDRPIDVGQRVRDLPPWYGRYGRIKGDQAREFARRADAAGLRIDISTDPGDVFPGDAWYRFLGSCRFTVGRKGGASMCDPDGSIRACVETYLAGRPEAGFDDVEAECFPGRDGHARMSAISPRLFDAAITGTCQILTRDDYLGALEPYVHYVPLADDFSNFDEVLELMRDRDRVESIVAASRRALIFDGNFTYASFAAAVFETDVAPYVDISSGRSAVPDVTAAPLELLQLVAPYHLYVAWLRLVLLAFRAGTAGSLGRFLLRFEDMVGDDESAIEILEPESFEANAVELPFRKGRLNEMAIEVARHLIGLGLVEAAIAWTRRAAEPDAAEWEFWPWLSPHGAELEAQR